MIRVILFTIFLCVVFPAHSEWKHEIKEDKMGRGSTEIASIESSNFISLLPPYDGPQNGIFALSMLKNGSNEFIVSIEKGQVICEPEECRLLIRVNDEKSFYIVGSHPKDGRTNILVGRIGVENLREIHSAKKLLVAITIYQNGEKILEFNSEGNPFIGRKGYLLKEISEMIKSGNTPNSIKYAEIPMDMPDFNICKKVANKPQENDELKVVDVNKKDILVVSSYFEDSVMRQVCKRGSKKSVISLFNYN